MRKNLKSIGVVLAVIIIIIMLLAGIYNGLVNKKEEVENKLADISVQLERRTDLIPNLISTVKGYASHEEKVINNVSTASENLINAKSVEDKANANQKLTDALNSLTVVVENYPDLKANTNFINLQDELAGTENRIAVARKDYNEAVKNYNREIKKFPQVLFARLFGFEEEKYFEAKESANNVPQVSFD